MPGIIARLLQKRSVDAGGEVDYEEFEETRGLRQMVRRLEVAKNFVQLCDQVDGAISQMKAALLAVNKLENVTVEETDCFTQKDKDEIHQGKEALAERIRVELLGD